MNLQTGKNQFRTLQNTISIPIAVFCMLMPFEEVMSGSFGSVLKLIGVAIIAIGVLYIKKIRISKTWCFLIVWAAYCLISYFWANSSEWWFYFFKIYASQVAFVLVLVQIPNEFINLEKIKGGIAIGALLAACFLIFFPTTSAYVEGRRTIVLGNANMNPNLLAAFLIMGLYVLFFWGAKRQKGLHIIQKMMYYGAILLVTTGLLYTGSRGALIALIGSALMVFFTAQKTHKIVKKWKAVVIALALLLLILMILKYMPEDYLESRFSMDNILGLNEYRSGAHNRYTIWLNAWTIFQDSPIIGYGCGNFFDAITKVYIQCAAHNIVVLSAVECGFLGSIPLFAFLFCIIRYTYRSGNLLAIGMQAAVFIISLTLDSLPYKYFWITIIITYWEAERQIRQRQESRRSDAARKYNHTSL